MKRALYENNIALFGNPSGGYFEVSTGEAFPVISGVVPDNFVRNGIYVADFLRYFSTVPM